MNTQHTYASNRLRRAIFVILLAAAGLFVAALIAPGMRASIGTLFAGDALAAQAKAAAAPTTGTTAAVKNEAAAPSKPAGWVFQPDPLDATALSLRERELKIQRREQEVAQAEARLESLRKEIEINLAHSQEVLKSMQRMAGEADTTRNKELKQWVSIYTAMKPAQAGPVFAGLDTRFALRVLAQMDPKNAGKILDNMPREQAIALGQQLGLKHP